MATTRIGLDRLPPAARAAVDEHTGPLLAVEESTEGFNSEIAARITSATGTWHIKGLRTDHPRAWTQHREATVAPFLTNLAPTLHWRVETAGWDLLGFEALDGHHANYAPNSPDLPEVAALLRRLGETPCPDIELRQAEQRLEHYAAHPDDLRHFAGTHLLHTDLNNTNILVNAHAPPGRSGPPGRLGLGNPRSSLARRRLLDHLAHRRRTHPGLRRALGRRNPRLAHGTPRGHHRLRHSQRQHLVRHQQRRPRPVDPAPRDCRQRLARTPEDWLNGDPPVATSRAANAKPESLWITPLGSWPAVRSAGFEPAIL